MQPVISLSQLSTYRTDLVNWEAHINMSGSLFDTADSALYPFQNSFLSNYPHESLFPVPDTHKTKETPSSQCGPESTLPPDVGCGKYKTRATLVYTSLPGHTQTAGSGELPLPPIHKRRSALLGSPLPSDAGCGRYTYTYTMHTWTAQCGPSARWRWC